jgi:NRPS condensation-like uncharacterized protein
VKEAYLTGAVKYEPYFQVAVSTFDDNCTLSCNMYGTKHDRELLESFLAEMSDELIHISSKY